MGDIETGYDDMKQTQDTKAPPVYAFSPKCKYANIITGGVW